MQQWISEQTSLRRQITKRVIPSAVGRPAGAFELAVASAECVEAGLALTSP